ncbi:MAG TPA: hypothetical protein VI503_01565 [Gaiellaceae bacterium]|nr:hypothetical protein [Gaiellaceae bacterium]
MERFNALGRGTQLMLVGAVLLLIDSFFRWQEISIDVLGVEASGGVSAWDDIGGIVMGLLTIVLLAWIVARLAAVDIPIPVSAAMTSGVLAFLIFAFALLKNLIDDYSTFWSYLGVAFAAVIAVGAWLQIQESGGIESLKSEATSLGSSGAAAPAAAPAEPAAEAPAPAAPAEAAPAEPAEGESSSEEESST